METPILTKKQQKKSLSAKKPKAKNVIKNVLATPYDISYWPLISKDEYSKLQKIFESNIPRMYRTKIKIPWKEIKDVPKEERKQVRETLINQQNSEEVIDRTESNNLVVGVNNVTKSLEQNLLAAVLITADVQPRFMVQHVIDLSILQKIPVLIVNNFRNLLLRTCGTSSAIFGIKRSNSEKLSPVLDCITEIYKLHPAPENHINFQRTIEDCYNKFDKKSLAVITTDMKKIESTNNKVDEGDEKAVKEKLYLKRQSKEVRVFVPAQTSTEVKKNKPKPLDVDEMGFLQFSDTINLKDIDEDLEIVDETPKVKKKERKSLYKPLIVKRLKGNPNRNKAKLDAIKKKKK